MPSPILSDGTPTRKGNSPRSENFTPYGLRSIHIPLALVPFPDISWGAKCLYGRLALFRGNRANGFCAPDVKTLARELGVSVRTVDGFLAELVQQSLIRRIRRGPGRPAECVFLAHPCIAEIAVSDTQGLADQNAVLVRKDRELDTQESADLDTQNSADPYIGIKHSSKNIHKNIYSSNQRSDHLRDHDDEIARDETCQTAWWEETGVVGEAVELLRSARASDCFGVSQARLAAAKIPDAKITIVCLSQFDGPQDFRSWLEDTVRRRLGQKAKSPGYALYAADARQYAEALKQRRMAENLEREAGRVAIEREREAMRAAEERKRAAAAAEELRMKTPMDPATAIASNATRVPEVLRLRLLRLGEPISPVAVMEQAGSWRKCPTCGDVGKTGNALEKTLEFCRCPAGEEAAHRDGYDWCAREIACVHASVKSRMVAAAREGGLEFTGDGIEESSVSDDGRAIEIVSPAAWAIAISQRDIEKLVARLGMDRKVELQKTGPGTLLVWSTVRHPVTGTLVPF